MDLWGFSDPMMLLAGTGYEPRGKKFSLACDKYKKRTHSGFAQWRERRGKTKTEGTTRRNNVFLLGTFFYLGNGKARRRRKIILATYSRTVIATTTRLADPFFPKFQDFPCLAPPLLLFFLSFFFLILHARLSGFGDFIRRLFSLKNTCTLFLDSKRKFSRKVQLANVPGQYFLGGGIMLFCALFMHIMRLGIHYGDSFESPIFFVCAQSEKSPFWVEGGRRRYFQIRGERDTHEIPKRHHRDFFKTIIPAF